MDFTRLPLNKRRIIVDCFIEDVTATKAARLASVNRKTANAWYAELRFRIGQLEIKGGQLSQKKFEQYHSRRMTFKNGLFSSVRDLHRLESAYRFYLKGKFGAFTLALADDLLS